MSSPLIPSERDAEPAPRVGSASREGSYDDIVTPVEFDFGLTGVSSAFHQDWGHLAATPLDLVRQNVGYMNPKEGVSLLMQDVMRLLTSPLSETDLAELWLACTDFYFPVGPLGAGRQWLWQVAGMCRPLLADAGVSAWWTLPECRHLSFDPVVAEWVSGLTLPDGVLPRTWIADFGPRLLLLAERVCADLATRILWRAMVNTGTMSPRPVYERLVRQSELFGYGYSFLQGVDYLVE